ncbi:MAG: VOC family protein [Ktedonobacterales bacterium]|nr:VOC family protein [Ktedonobacterales bacterium]
MEPRIDLLTILTDDVPTMVAFYRDVLGIPVRDDHGAYVEFGHEGVRLAICSRAEMISVTGAESYRERRAGQTIELAFRTASPDEVDSEYTRLVAAGAKPIHAPATMPWGMRTGFFADPDGNIHEVFAEGAAPGGEGSEERN